jgi:hypothetical protein
VNVAQRIVELLIGRLLTDEEFRTSFLDDPEGTLLDLCRRGFELTPIELAALINTDRSLWELAAERLDPRLQKASLVHQPESPKASTHHV